FKGLRQDGIFWRSVEGVPNFSGPRVSPCKAKSCRIRCTSESGSTLATPAAGLLTVIACAACLESHSLRQSRFVARNEISLRGVVPPTRRNESTAPPPENLLTPSVEP